MQRFSISPRLILITLLISISQLFPRILWSQFLLERLSMQMQGALYFTRKFSPFTKYDFVLNDRTSFSINEKRKLV